MISQVELARILTSASERGRFLASPERAFPPVRVDQLEITAQIVAYKRREALGRWFPSTVAACEAVATLRDRLEKLCDEPIPMYGPGRRLRCAEALAAALRPSAAVSTLQVALQAVLRLETEILKLTYDPPAGETLFAEGSLVPADAGPAPTVSVRLSCGVRILRFPFDIMPLWERPAEVAPLLDSQQAPSPPGPPAAVALLRRPELQPVRALRLGSGAADILEVSRRGENVGALLDAFPQSRRDAVLSAIREALANGLLVVT